MAISASYDGSTQDLTVTGDGADNAIIVSRDVPGALLVNGGAVPISGGPATVANTDLILVTGDLGSDTIALDETNGALPAAKLYGGGGIDTLTGGSNADTLDGGTGADTLNGLGGDDWFYVDSASDVVNEASTGGTDRVFASVSYALGTGAEVEALSTTDSAGTSAINLTGNGEFNAIIGNAGNNILDGGGGYDTLYGYGGDDWFHVDFSQDQVFEIAGNGTDRVFASRSYVLRAGVHVETLSTNSTLGTTTINLTGNELANTLIGNAGNNILDGGGGADALYGYGGDDWYYLDNPSDQVFEAAGAGNDRVIARLAAYTLPAEVEILMFSGNQSFAGTGNALANYITGSELADVLDGRGGADTMQGKGGDDRYYVDNAADMVDEAEGNGTDRVFTSVSFALIGYQPIETLGTTDSAGTAAINLTGSFWSNTLIGNAGNNILNGGEGADTLYGYGGDDFFYVDNAADVVFEGVGAGADRVFASASYALGAGAEVETLSTANNAGTTAIDLTGNELANSLVGNAGSNVLDGRGGADTLNGYGGADTFRFTTALGGGNVDAIQGYNPADDVIQLDDAVFAGLALGTLAAGAVNVGVAATQADDRIIYNFATGALLFDADGVGGIAAVQFATITPGLALGVSEFFVI